MLDIFADLVNKGNAKSAFNLLYKAETCEVVECLHSLGVTAFSGSKEKMIDANKQAVLNACSANNS